MSLCNWVQSSIELIVRYKRISSAYNLILEVTFKGISFTKHRKRMGAKTVPWGTPDTHLARIMLE